LAAECSVIILRNLAELLDGRCDYFLTINGHILLALTDARQLLQIGFPQYGQVPVAMALWQCAHIDFRLVMVSVINLVFYKNFADI